MNPNELAQSLDLPKRAVALVLAGGRGKGRFKSGLQGGVHVVFT